MNTHAPGWRSRRWSEAPKGVPSAPSAISPEAVAGDDPSSSLLSWAVGDVKFSAAYLALLIYVFCVVTQRISFGTPAMAAALLALPFEKRRAPTPTFLFLLWAFLGWAFAGSFTSWQGALTSQNLETLAKVSLIALVASRVNSDLPRIRLFALVQLGSFMVYPVRGALNAYMIGHRVYGRAVWQYAYDNPNDLAAFCYWPLALSIWLAKDCPHRIIRIALRIAAALMLLLIFLTQSRGALIGLTLTGLLFLFQAQGGARLKRLAQLGLLLLCIVPFVPSSAWERFGGMSKLTSTSTVADADPEGSAGGRYAIWRNALAIIEDYPAMGVGLGAYPFANWAYALRLQYHPASLGHRDTHSTYLNVAAETGLPGLLIFLVMIGVSFGGAEAARRKTTIPSIKDLLRMQELALLAFMLAGIFGSFSRLNTLYLQMSVLSATGAVALGRIAGGRSASTTARISARVRS